MASVQLLQVINTSFNFPIYWFVGNFRQTFLSIFCDCNKTKTTNRAKFDWTTRTSTMSLTNEPCRRPSADLSRVDMDIFKKTLASRNASQAN